MLFAGTAAKLRSRQYTARTRATSPLNEPRPVSTADRSSQTLLQISANLSEFIVVNTYRAALHKKSDQSANGAKYDS